MIQNNNKILAVVMVVFIIIITIASICLFNQKPFTQTNDNPTSDTELELNSDATEVFDADTEKTFLHAPEKIMNNQHPLDSENHTVTNDINTSSDDVNTSSDDETMDCLENNDSSDDVVSDSEASSNISIYEQMAIDAGYGVVVDIGDGDYAVLTHNDGYVNGQWGSDILRTYLDSQELTARSVMGGYIQESNDWYWFIAYDVHEIDTSGNEW